MKTKNKLFPLIFVLGGQTNLSLGDLTWDTTNGDGMVVGGDGIWDTTTAGWTDDSGATNLSWDNTTHASDLALFPSGTGRVNVSEDINLAGMVVSSLDNSSIGGRPSMTYVLEGTGTLNFGSQQGLIDTFGSGLLGFQIGNRLVGSNGVLFNGADAPATGQGFVYLAGDNTGLTGGVTIENGMVGVWDQTNLGANGIALNGNAGLIGPINYSGPVATVVAGPTELSINNDISVSGTGNMIRVWGGRTFELAGEIAGTGALSKTDGGTLVMAHNNSLFSGEFSTIANGIIRGTADHAFGTGTIKMETETGGVTRLELAGVTIGNDVEIHSGAQTGFQGVLVATGDLTSTVTGDVTVFRGVGNGGHLAAIGTSELLLNGELNVGGAQGSIVHRIGTIVYGGGGSTGYNLTIAEGTAKLGANNGISTQAVLNLSGSGASTFDVGSFDQTVVGLIHTANNQSRVMNITGSGSLTVDAQQNIELGPGGTLSAARNFTANFSGLEEFVWNGEGRTFRVGLRSGTGNSFSGNTGTFLTELANHNTITASLLAVGDMQANNHGGNSFLRLGETNQINADTINIGTSNRSNATLNFRDGLTAPTATIRGEDGSSAVTSWDVGKVANFSGVTWTSEVDLSAGEIDARVGTLRVAIANPGPSTNRQGTQVSTFRMGAGVLAVDDLIVGQLSGTTGSSSNTYAADGTFHLNNANGTLRATNLILADNIATFDGATRNVRGTFNLDAGTLQAETISRGAQSGVATSVTAIFNFSGGTVRNLGGTDLTVSDLAINLSGSGSREFFAAADQAITFSNDAPITGAGGFSKTGSGTMVIESNSDYQGNTMVSAGTLFLTGQLSDSSVLVEGGATFGGTGSLALDLGLAASSTFEVVDVSDPLTVAGTVSFGAGFGIGNIEGIAWDSVDLYTPITIISTTQTFTAADLNNFGADNAVMVGSTGRLAFFEEGSLQVVVIPEPSGAFLGGLGLLLLLRRRRS